MAVILYFVCVLHILFFCQPLWFMEIFWVFITWTGWDEFFGTYGSDRYKGKPNIHSPKQLIFENVSNWKIESRL